MREAKNRFQRLNNNCILHVGLDDKILEMIGCVQKSFLHQLTVVHWTGLDWTGMA
jgi:hypothetical protein